MNQRLIERLQARLTDGVKAFAVASVTTNGASKGFVRLRGGIINIVSRFVATSLEGVVEAKPVTDFVRCGLCGKRYHQLIRCMLWREGTQTHTIPRLYVSKLPPGTEA